MITPSFPIPFSPFRLAAELYPGRSIAPELPREFVTRMLAQGFDPRGIVAWSDEPEATPLPLTQFALQTLLKLNQINYCPMATEAKDIIKSWDHSHSLEFPNAQLSFAITPEAIKYQFSTDYNPVGGVLIWFIDWSSLIVVVENESSIVEILTSNFIPPTQVLEILANGAMPQIREAPAYNATLANLALDAELWFDLHVNVNKHLNS